MAHERGEFGCGSRLKLSLAVLLNRSNLCRRFEEVLYFFKRMFLLPAYRIISKS